MKPNSRAVLIKAIESGVEMTMNYCEVTRDLPDGDKETLQNYLIDDIIDAISDVFIFDGPVEQDENS